MLTEFQRIHFIGIGGIGMSGLAQILISQGKTVSGSDLKSNTQTEELNTAGARIYHVHAPENLPADTDYVVVSTAISPNNPEYQAAQAQNIPIIHRSEVLRYLLANSRGISVTGTHGKTTTSGLLSVLLTDQDLDPTIVIGGEIPQLGTNAKAGEGVFTVAEVDESDQSLRKLSTEIAIITNLEVDHLDHYQGLDEIIEAVLEFINNQPAHGKTIINLDDPGIQLLLDRLPEAQKKRCVSFSLHNPDADYQAINPNLQITSSHFELLYKGQSLGHFELGIPGIHNIYNALSALACSHMLGFDLHKVKASLKAYRGVKRRFQLIGELSGDVKVIDDYGHHPSEILATLSTAKLQNRSITAIFQPHRYSRTQAFLNEFASAFGDAERVIFTDIYAASENPADFTVTIQQLVEKTRQTYPKKTVLYFSSFEEIKTYLLDNLLPREVILTIGAGTITDLSRLLVESGQPAGSETAGSEKKKISKEHTSVYASLGLNAQPQIV